MRPLRPSSMRWDARHCSAHGIACSSLCSYASLASGCGVTHMLLHINGGKSAAQPSVGEWARFLSLFQRCGMHLLNWSAGVTTSVERWYVPICIIISLLLISSSSASASSSVRRGRAGACAVTAPPRVSDHRLGAQRARSCCTVASKL